eukprot:scaffold13786_cov58-Phaeocystis_antarctica.AAC.6
MDSCFDHHTRNDISHAARLRAQGQLVPSALMPVPFRVHSELGTDQPPVYSSGIRPTVHICGLPSCAAGLQAARGRVGPECPGPSRPRQCSGRCSSAPSHTCWPQRLAPGDVCTPKPASACAHPHCAATPRHLPLVSDPSPAAGSAHHARPETLA